MPKYAVWLTSLVLITQMLATVGCGTVATTPTSARAVAPILERDQAQARAKRISNVHYDLSLKLYAENIPFEGEAAIRFELMDGTQPLTVDFVDGDVLSVELNGQAVEATYNGYFITLPARYLEPGAQHLKVRYTHSYRKDGTGLHWFKDPVDGETYLYTQFEAWDFNKVFPGFDQPDIKATYALDVEVPAHWQVISATRETTVTEVNEQRKHWRFPPSHLFSTYVFSLHAGPYHVWQDPQDFRVPLRLFARQSYAEYVDVDEWFEVTRKGFDFFERYFEYDYPFGKYDQVLAPEFVFGAMENVGAVTFAERLQPRREKSSGDREVMAIVVLHELAHHWFGNLVTMRWWDDIWLNESFADLMGNYAAAEVTDHKGAMVSFSTSRKSWGYNEDQWITTHPIVQNIGNTEMVLASIDGITYAKGAATLIQLQHLLGADVFQRGLANYFDRYAWGNTEMTDFIGTLGDTAGRDLTSWIEQWLKQAGVNALKAHYMCGGGRLTSLNIEQVPANLSGAIREHRLDVLLIDKDGGRSIIDVTLKQQHNPQPEAIGLPCPAFILPNVSDYTFARVLLDKHSIQYVREHFAEFINPVERGIIWRSLFESVKEGELPATDYLDIAIKYLATEPNPPLLATQLRNVEEAYAFLALRPFVSDDDGGLAAYYRDKLEQLAWQRYLASPPALARPWLGLWVSHLHSSEHLQRAKTLLAESDDLPLDDRWALAGALVRESDDAASLWIETLTAQDNSANAELNRLSALALAPERDVKVRWINEAQDPDTDYAYTQLRTILDNLFPIGQHALHLQLKNEIIDPLPSLVGAIEPALFGVYARSLVPLECSLDARQHWLRLAAIQDLPSTANKALLKKSQAESQCVKVQQRLDAQYNPAPESQ